MLGSAFDAIVFAERLGRNGRSLGIGPFLFDWRTGKDVSQIEDGEGFTFAQWCARTTTPDPLRDAALPFARQFKPGLDEVIFFEVDENGADFIGAHGREVLLQEQLEAVIALRKALGLE